MFRGSVAPNNSFKREPASRVPLIQALGGQKHSGVAATAIAILPAAHRSLVAGHFTFHVPLRHFGQVLRPARFRFSAACLRLPAVYRVQFPARRRWSRLLRGVFSVGGRGFHSYGDPSRLTIHSSGTRFAGPLNSGVRRPKAFGVGFFGPAALPP